MRKMSELGKAVIGIFVGSVIADAIYTYKRNKLIDELTECNKELCKSGASMLFWDTLVLEDLYRNIEDGTSPDIKTLNKLAELIHLRQKHFDELPEWMIEDVVNEVTKEDK